MKRPIALLDRDGTLIHDRPGFYLRRPEQVRVYPHAAPALRLLKAAGYRLVVVSNQSGLGRGYFDHPTLGRIHARLKAALRRGGASVDAIYFCPHVPADACACRKPKPLLGRKALRRFAVRRRGSAVFGDKKVDMDFARALGLPGIHVGTGHGRSERERWGARLACAHRSRTLLEGARWLLGSGLKKKGKQAIKGRGR